MKKVAVVILNYLVKDLTLKCIQSVRNSSFRDIIIIVVDNNSQDGLDDEIEKLEGILFIQTKKNLGYAGGNNVGIKKAMELNAELIFILNPDTEVDKEAIKYLVGGIEKYSAGIACPKIYFEDRKTIWFAGKDFDNLNVLGKHRGVDEIDRGQFDEDQETEASGAAMLIKKEVIEKVGMLDERFFLYLEDSDFSKRVKNAGFRIMYIYSSKVYHKNAQSTGLGSPVQDYFFTRNRMLFAKKHLSLRTQFALYREALKNFFNPVRRMALIDFMIGKLGKGSLDVIRSNYY